MNREHTIIIHNQQLTNCSFNQWWPNAQQHVLFRPFKSI